MTRSRALVAGVGNVLRGDDGFGPAVIEALRRDGLPADVEAIEVGIGGMALVLELMEGYDSLIVVDAVRRDSQPGTLHVLEPIIPAVAGMTDAERHALAADAHELVPARVLILAGALDVLPRLIRFVGCEPGSTDELSMALSAPVAAAVPRAAKTVRGLLEESAAALVAR